MKVAVNTISNKTKCVKKIDEERVLKGFAKERDKDVRGNKEGREIDEKRGRGRGESEREGVGDGRKVGCKRRVDENKVGE